MIRRKISAFISLLLTAALLGSCSDGGSDEPQKKWPDRPKPETADQTVLFYLSGQSLLRYFRDTNIPEIKRAIDEHILYDSRVLVFIQPSARQSLLIEYSFDYDTQGCRADTLRRYEELSSIRSADIARVFTDVGELAPAKRYGLVLGSHGGGWVPALYKDLNTNEDDAADPDFLSLGGSTPFDWLHKSPGAEATRWFGEHDYETADLKEWAAAFELSPIDFEYMIFDACFMSNIESLYRLRHAARYIVGSPCEIMGRGMPYATTLPDLFTDKGRSYDLEAFCRHFYDYYATTTSTRQSGCIALTVTEELDELARRMKALNAAAQADPDLSGLQIYEGLDRPLFFDFRQYAERISGDASLLDAFREQFDRTFPEPCRFHTPSFYSGFNGRMNPVDYYSGVTVSTPSDKFPAAWAETEWAQATEVR